MRRNYTMYESLFNVAMCLRFTVAQPAFVSVAVSCSVVQKEVEESAIKGTTRKEETLSPSMILMKID